MGAARGKKDSKTWIHTATGTLDLVHPDVKDITLEAVARGLSREMRFAGQSDEAYSVAQHACIGAQLFRDEAADADSEDDALALLDIARVFLHHDDSEAFLRDLPRPVKYTKDLDGFRVLEDRMQEACYRAFEIDNWRVFAKEVAAMDQRLCATELDVLFHSEMLSQFGLKFVPWTSEQAYNNFIALHKALFGVTFR